MSCQRIFLKVIALISLGTNMAQASATPIAPAIDASEFKLNVVSIEKFTFKGKEAFEVAMPRDAYQDPEKEVLTDRANLAWIPIDFHNGTIEVDVAAVLARDAPNYARGFIGLGFRIDSNLSFEGIYLRPANSRSDDQVRRNHSVQYFALPGYGFERLRKDAPEKYESYVDIELGEWSHMKIEVHDCDAKLYVNRAKQPSLVVHDLKLGPEHKGGVGFWIDSGTLGYFRNLKVTSE
ncbi:hypothetical protein SAMN04515620_1589 [Collimonas sp. OK607]|uniref:DUF1080 domain-containing protein n=1 Tax=Collimonas sp. OK607 TaxID=1798194 RepID=UPI0008E10BF2|nr:DUF1080 domain-containing protein [Collimonas sp. OK607]SFB38202.1 hypothetical protein SAMN04515620_1589 [Collimonas sp. OK607]